jgi:hypothetical protein
MFYALKIPALDGDLSLRHQFTYRNPDEENGQEYKTLWAVIEVRGDNAQIVSDGYHSGRKAMEVVNCFNNTNVIVSNL